MASLLANPKKEWMVSTPPTSHALPAVGGNGKNSTSPSSVTGKRKRTSTASAYSGSNQKSSNTVSTSNSNNSNAHTPSFSSGQLHPPSSETGTGSFLLTNVVYAIDYLRSQNRPVSYNELFGSLSLLPTPLTSRLQVSLKNALQAHPRVKYDPNGIIDDQDSGSSFPTGTYQFKPKHDVRSKDELIGFLQRQSGSKGLSVKELKDGWPTAAQAVDELERSGLVLVARNRKDQSPRMVWLDDPSLTNQTAIDPEFRKMWERVKLPSDPEELRIKLEAAGLKPASSAKVFVHQKREKKRKALRKGGRQTNTHMLGILRDYSHKRK